MKNIWLDIDLNDYENHMALPNVAQAQYLANYLDKTLGAYHSNSVAILGCSGGNGLEKLTDKNIEKIICVDINPDFLIEAKNRFKDSFKNIEFICEDISTADFKIDKVDLIFAGLILEYVEIESSIQNISESLNHEGLLAIVIQQPNEHIDEVSPSKYTSLKKLGKIFNFISSVELIKTCNNYNFRLISQKETELKSSKIFTELIFQKS